MSDRETKDEMIMPTCTRTYPENLVKIGPIHYEIIWSLSGLLKRRI